MTSQPAQPARRRSHVSAQERHGAGCRRFVPGSAARAHAIHRKASSRCSALRANRCYGNPPKSQRNENNDNDVADRHAFLLEEKRCCENRALPTGPAQYEEPAGGATEKTGLDQ